MSKKLLAAALGIVTVLAMAPGLATATGVGDAPAPNLVEDGDAQLTPSNELTSVCEAPSTADALVSQGPDAIPAECDNGEFVRTGDYIGIGFGDLPYAEEGWTGHFEAWLEWEGGELGFRVSFNNGQIESTEVLTPVQWPGIGDTFDHYCLAYESQTTLELPIAEHAWGCAVFGDISR